MPEAPAIVALGAATLNRDWRLEVDSGSSGTALPALTVTTGSATITSATPHLLALGQQVTLSAVQTPFVIGTTYFVVSTPTTTTFTLSATSGGAAISATASGAMTGTRGVLWTIVRGRTDFKPAIDSKLQDDSDMDSTGWQSQTRTAAQWTLEIKLVRKAVQGALVVGTTTSYDPGQEVLRLAGDQVGPYNSVLCRWYKLGAVRTEAYQGYASVDWSPDGGDMSGLDTASVKLTGQGPRVSIAHPYNLP